MLNTAEFALGMIEVAAGTVPAPLLLLMPWKSSRNFASPVVVIDVPVPESTEAAPPEVSTPASSYTKIPALGTPPPLSRKVIATVAGADCGRK